MIGRTLAHYEIVARLGAGGMGEVFRAHDSKLGRDVALKTLPAELATHRERNARFQREARTLASLSHPNIVVIHSVEEADGIPFLTMELVEGKTLDEITPSDGLPIQRFLELAIELVGAVEAAHRRGITHRDLKPANVMVDADGRVKVLDFGVAKLLDARMPEDDDVTAATALGGDDVSAEGRIVGTAAYMAPEQAEGRPLDHRADIFSLGVVLYEMATGRRPFRGDTPMSTLSAVLRDDPVSVTELRGDLPRHLGRIIRRCLQKDPDRRHQSAADLRNDLRDLREELDSGELETIAPSIPPRRGRFLAAVVPSIAVILLALVAALVWLRGGDEARAVKTPTLTQTAVTSSGRILHGVISPDGNYVAYVEQAGGADRLLVKQLATGSDVEIIGPSDRRLGGVRMTPDGQHVLYRSRAVSATDGRFDIMQIPLLGGRPQRLVRQAHGDFALSHDGERLAYFRVEEERQGLFVALGDGSEERLVLERAPGATAFEIAWSPDGRRVLTVERQTDSDGSHESAIIEIDVEQGRTTRTGEQRWTWVSNLLCTRDGRVYVAGTLGEQRYQDMEKVWELESLAATPRLVAGGLASYFGLSMDREGETLATVVYTVDQSTWLVPGADPGKKKRIEYLPRIGRWYLSADWTPDGKILMQHKDGDHLHVRALSPDGAESTLLTSEGPFNMGGVASPDGERVAFFSNREGSMKLYLADIDGGDVRRLTTDTWEEFFPSFSPDGRWIYYHTNDGTEMGWFVRRVSTSGGPSELLSDTPAYRPRVSPDGRRLLVVVHSSAVERGLAIIPAEGGEPELLELEGIAGWTAVWHPSGDALTASAVGEDAPAVWTFPLDGRPRRKLVEFERGQVAAIDWDRAGETLAVVTSEEFGDLVLLRGF